jgi:hypothetical protein
LADFTKRLATRSGIKRFFIMSISQDRAPVGCKSIGTADLETKEAPAGNKEGYWILIHLTKHFKAALPRAAVFPHYHERQTQKGKRIAES